MKLQNIVVIIGILTLAFTSCRKEFDFVSASQNFRFSKDTLFLDTVFTTIRSETYAVKIYNQEDKDVVVPRIHLAEGANSYYKINVDGQAGYDFSDVPLRAKDSLFVFVEIAPLVEAPNYSIAEEDLIVDNASGSQTVKLISLVEDAEFFFPAEGETEVELSGNINWDNSKSKVIFGNLKITNGSSLTMNAGTKVYFHKKSGLEMESGSTLTINGTLQDEVVLRGDRHDLRYDTLPANWEQIKLNSGASATINYAKIMGGLSGLEMDNASATISNTKFYNHYSAGIFAQNSTINAHNLLMNNCGEADLALVAGGNYNFNHCTLANYFDLGAGNAYSLYVTNHYEDDEGNILTNNLTANFGNSIFYAKGISSLAYSDDGFSTFNTAFTNCLVKYATTTDPIFNNCIFNQDPLFTNTLASANNLLLKGTSPAKNAGSNAITSLFPTDYYGNTRGTNATLGAIE